MAQKMTLGDALRQSRKGRRGRITQTISGPTNAAGAVAAAASEAAGGKLNLAVGEAPSQPLDRAERRRRRIAMGISLKGGVDAATARKLRAQGLLLPKSGHGPRQKAV